MSATIQKKGAKWRVAVHLHKQRRYISAPTKKAAVEAGLRLLAETHAQGSIRQLRGKVRWQGDLNQSRMSRVRA